MHRGVFLAFLLLSIVVPTMGCGPFVTKLITNRVESNLQADLAAELPDGLHALVCGAGGPLDDPKRSAPCVAIIAGQTVIVVDSGGSAARNLGRFGLPPGQVDAVFLTHFHSDHIDGLGEMATLRWAGSAAKKPLPVHGPYGVGQVVDGFNLAYRFDQKYRNEHHGEATVPLAGWGLTAVEYPSPKPGGNTIIYDRKGLIIRAFAVDHAPIAPAVGYRFEYKGRSIVISGDTSKSDNLIAQAKDVDLLIHEALSPALVGLMNQAAKNAGAKNIAKITSDILNYHASPIEAAESAEEAGADYLLYYHVVPPLPISTLEDIYLRGVRGTFKGQYKIAVDGTFISLPAGTDRIVVDER